MGVVFAFGTVPKDSGTFTFYRNLRPVLAEWGIDMRAVSVGKAQAQLWDPAFSDDGCVQLAPDSYNVKRQAQEFERWCDVERVDVVMGINSEAILSAIPHLPDRIRVLSRCANGFDHGYRITMSGAGRLAGIVAVSPRLKQDLIGGYDAPEELVTLIPNGIDPAPFETAAGKPRGAGKRLELGFLGRLEHNQKGVFHLPQIAGRLARSGIDFRLRIAGKGKHRKALEKARANGPAADRVELVGPLEPAAVPEFLAGIDVFLFTSHFEGFPNALLEAMAAGCVPVAWRLDGITDFILDHGVTGFLSEVGDYEGFCRVIAELDRDRERLREMSRAVAADARSRFNNRSVGKAYAELIHRVLKEQAPFWKPLPWEKFRADPNFETGWKVKLMRFPAINRLVALLRDRSAW